MQTTQQPHRPGPLHQTNKAHKGGRHSRKSSATTEIKSKCIAKPISAVRREERLNQATQNRKLKRERTIEEKRKLGSESHPPLVIGVLDIHMNSCKSFFEALSKSEIDAGITVKSISDRVIYVVSRRLKMRFNLIALDSRNFDETLDIVKTVDLMMLLYKPNAINHDEDYEISQLLRSIYIHCLPTLIHVLDGSDIIDEGDFSAKLVDAKRTLRGKIKDEKMHSIGEYKDFSQLFHLMSTTKRQKSQFKNARPTVVVDKAEMVDGSLTLMGFVRKKTLSPNDLAHIVGYGDYQIKKIDILPDIVALKPGSVEGAQVVQTLMPDPMKQETLEQENEIDPMEGEQTWPTAQVERMNTKRIIKKLPPGTSEYQGAWIPEDSDEEQVYSEWSDCEHDTEMKDIAEKECDISESEDDSDPEYDVSNLEEDNEAVAMDVDNYDKNNPKEKELKVLEKLKEARMEEMFPDEIDTPIEMPARLRFARYRGLKSFRKSAWDPQENLPTDYQRIFQFQNFSQTKRRVLCEESHEGANPGQYVRIHLADVPEKASNHILSQEVPPALIGLLKYERKMTVMNLLLKRSPESNLNNPIKSKDELIFYCGFRKFKAKPIFTTHSVSSKFKYERFLRDDVAMVATIYAPITFPPAPVLVFRENHKNEKELVATGSVLESNPNRLIIKRIRLSGHPFKIHSKSAVIRFMFFNSEDVTYFKPVELTSKYTRRGHISEPLGTHGHMKCTFDKKIRSDDCIFMNLYKRVFPKWTYTPICQY